MSNLLQVTILLIAATFVPSDAASCPNTGTYVLSSCTCDATAARLEEMIQQLNETTEQLRKDMMEKCNNTNTSSESDPTIAFHAVIRDIGFIDQGDEVTFDDERLDEGDGYDVVSAKFTVPPGGDGLYYFYVHLVVQGGGYGDFQMIKTPLNESEVVICELIGDDREGTNEFQTATCAATVRLTEDEKVWVKYFEGTNSRNTPLRVSNDNGFTGFFLKR